jgi:hypothetical protein
LAGLQGTHASDIFAEGFALEQFHREARDDRVPTAGLREAVFHKVVNATKIFVRDFAGNTDLAAEPAQRLGVARQLAAERFQSDREAEFLVISFVDFPHAAAGDEP